MTDRALTPEEVAQCRERWEAQHAQFVALRRWPPAKADRDACELIQMHDDIGALLAQAQREAEARRSLEAQIDQDTRRLKRANSQREAAQARRAAAEQRRRALEALIGRVLDDAPLLGFHGTAPDDCKLCRLHQDLGAALAPPAAPADP